MATAVLTLSVHPVITEDQIDNHRYALPSLDLSGLARVMENYCRDGNPNAVVRIADSYLDLDGTDYIQQQRDPLATAIQLGDRLQERASVRGASRNGVIAVAEQWKLHMGKDMHQELLCPSVFYFVVRASTSLMVGDWINYALSRFDSFTPPAWMRAFGVSQNASSKGHLPEPVRQKLVEMFGLDFHDHARLSIACRRD